MDYRNADGSIAEMCGNGLRVFARYLLEHGLAAGPSFAVATRSGIRQVRAEPDGQISVDMGPATVLGRGQAVVGGVIRDGLRVSVGNPHLACLVDDALDKFDLAVPPGLDPADFPDGGNVELVRRTGPDAISMRVHERGSGETRSCWYRRGRGCGSSSRSLLRNENRPPPVARHGAGWRAAGDAGGWHQLADRAGGDRGRGGARPGLAGGPLASRAGGSGGPGCRSRPGRSARSPQAAERGVEHLGDVRHRRDGRAGGRQRRGDLQAAAGVGGDDQGCPGGRTEAAFRAPSSPAASGCSRLYTPAEPQQVPASDTSASSSPGMVPSSSLGWRRMPCACPRWHAS